MIRGVVQKKYLKAAANQKEHLEYLKAIICHDILPGSVSFGRLEI